MKPGQRGERTRTRPGAAPLEAARTKAPQAGERPGPLEKYRQKRHFDVTSEPAPKPVSKPAGPLRFMVHKHDATRLHYDLRLEMEGVLASWAVPKGPTLDPSVKRLAVQTEDHPLEYGDFEGRIPEGEYGAGDSLIWDRGNWDTVPPGQATAMMRKGHLEFVLHGEKLRGRWHLVRTRRTASHQEWLLFKASDEFTMPGDEIVERRPESVASGRRITRGPVRARAMRARHPPPLELLMKVWPPMLATLATAPPKTGRFLHEVKYDGFRALAGLSDGRVSLQSRSGLDLAPRFPGIVRALEKVVVPEAVIDGEIIALDAEGNARFELMQNTAGRLRFVAFDLLWLDGEDLRERRLEARRDLLESVLAQADPNVMLAERMPEELTDALSEARRRGLEGVIGKRLGSPYRGGRSRDWLKHKVRRSQEVAIVGWLPMKGEARMVGALLVAVHDGRSFRFAGRVGTGFANETRESLYRALENDERAASPVAPPVRVKDARWVTPRLVAQVAFTEWTSDGALRHPIFRGLREDKSPEECRRE